MSHLIWHCGLVGERSPDITVNWEAYWRMTCGYKLSANVTEKERKKLEKRIDRRIARMADIAAECFDDHLEVPPAYHPDLVFAGEYKGFAFGDPGPVVPLDPFPVASDLVLTYSFFSMGLSHAQASALSTRLDIQRYKAYLDVYEVTGGEIHPYSHLETEVPED